MYQEVHGHQSDNFERLDDTLIPLDQNLTVISILKSLQLITLV